MGYEENSIYKLLLEFSTRQSLSLVGAVFSHPQTNFKHLAKGTGTKTVAIVPCCIDPSKHLKGAVCREMVDKRPPLDCPSTFAEDVELFEGLSLLFHYNRKFPPARYSITWKGDASGEGFKSEKQSEQIEGEKEQQGNDASGTESSNDTDMLMQIQPSPSTSYPPVLITGKASPAQIAKMNNFHGSNFSVFFVPHQDTAECLSLLPEDTRDKLSSTTLLYDASLHLALYHKRKSFRPYLDKLKGTKLEESGKSFKKFCRDCKPEDELQAMLQDPEAKPCPFLISENAQLKWYKNQKRGHGVFADSEVERAVSDEEKKQYKRIVFLRDSLAWAHFFKHFHAEMYIISAEDLKQKEHPDVLNGIIIASIWQKRKCSIVITGSLPLPLDKIIQRDVRKLAYPQDGKSSPTVSVGFLDKCSPACARPFPFFTINPWSQAQSHVSPHHTVSVDTSKHEVTGIGNEPQLSLIVDELDIMEVCSTSDSNADINHITYSHTPRTKVKGQKCLPGVYLSKIGHKTCPSYGVDEVLKCLIGPSLVQQLMNISTKHQLPEPNLKIIPELLKQRASVNSNSVTLTPTGTAASEGSVDVKISPTRPLSIRVGDIDVQVRKAFFTVKKAKTMAAVITCTVDVTINSEPRKLQLDVSKYVNLTGSCGVTVADHIYSICSKEDAWSNAGKRTIGEILYVFLRERNTQKVVQSLPLFLSFPLIKCRICHYLSTVIVDSSQTLQEAHLHVQSFELDPILIGTTKFGVHIKSLAMHLFPMRDPDRQMIEIEGECYLKKSKKVNIPLKFTCSSTSDTKKHLKFFFDSTFSPEDVFEIFGVESPASLTPPVSGYKFHKTIKCEGGFVLSQLLGSTKESSLTSLFFGVEYCNEIDAEIQQSLPPSLSHIKNFKVRTVVHFPSARAPMLGLEASFVAELAVPESQTGCVILDCSLSICPSIMDNTYSYELTISQQSDQQDFKGMSVYAIILALSDALGKNVKKEIGCIPEVGGQILDSVALTNMVLRLSGGKIMHFELHATMSELDIVANKLSIKDCALKILYSEKGLELECSGNLVFLRHYSCSVQFCLPTKEKMGVICFDSSHSGLPLKDVMHEFGLLSPDVKSNPVLSDVLSVEVKRAALGFKFTPGDAKLQIVTSEISIFKESLDISLLTFRGVSLDVSTELLQGSYVTSFTLEAYVAKSFHAQLKYDPKKSVMSGEFKVTFSKSVSAVDVLELFESSTNSYKNMQGMLQDEFMDVFTSDLKIMTQPGLTASLFVSINLPSEHSKHYSLGHLNLEVEDVLKICCKKSSYVLNRFRFEYINKSGSKDISSTSRLLLLVHKVNAEESMTLDFDFTVKKDDSSSVTARVEAGPKGGFLRLRSAIDLASAAVPGLPDFVRLPPIFDVELVSGSITFNLRPSLKPSAFDINILIKEWQVFEDPELTVHEVTLKTTWETGNYPQLTFTDCSLTFLGHALQLSGRLTSDEVLIECCSAKKLAASSPTDFQSILNDCTPTSHYPRPVVPTNIGLPPMQVEIKELIIHLKEMSKKFRLNTRVIASSPWMIKFGSQSIPVRELGGALEWEKLKNRSDYKAFLYGTIELFGMQVDMEMLLGSNVDSIVAATISHPKSLHYGQVADNLLCSEAVVPYDQYNAESSGLSQLVPSTLHDISLVSASTALNVTKRQFFLSSEVQGWGTGSVLVGYLVNKNDLDYIVSLSLGDNLTFSRFSKSLAFVDQLVWLKSVDVLVSSIDVPQLSDITKNFKHSFTRSPVHKSLQKPFYESKLLNNAKLMQCEVRAGTTVYAEIDVALSRGAISKVLQLGDGSVQHDVAIMTYIGQDKTKTDLEIRAWIPIIKLFNCLTFSDIELMYKVKAASELKLTGKVALDLSSVSNSRPLEFDGELYVNASCAKFSTRWCSDLVNQPCGIDITVNDLKLALKMYFNGESPDVYVSGRLKIAFIHLTCRLLLKGVNFKVFHIRLEQGLKLSALFSCNVVDWPVKLDITIKEGQFYYSRSDVTFDEEGTISVYKSGYHLEAIITLFNSDFRIEADISDDHQGIVLRGRSIEPVDFGFAQITGERPHTHEGPALSYEGSKDEKSLILTLGVEILRVPCFEGELKYMFRDKSLEGTIRYPGRILWIDEPSMKVRWSKEDGFQIVDFSLFGDVPGFSLLGAIGKFAKIIYNIVKGILSWSIKLHLKTGRNPNPEKHLLKIVLYGELTITVIGFTIPVFPLPEIPLLLPRVDDFSFSKLPGYILKGLWDSIGPICKSLLNYINPWNLLKKSAEMIWNGIKGAAKTVVNVAKKIGSGVKKAWRGFRRFFGFSAFIVDDDNGMVLGYIRGGKGGQKLKNIKFVVNKFGPILTANAIGAMAHDIHDHFKSCISAQSYDEEKPVEEVDGESVDLEAGLEELKVKAEELSQKLTIIADQVLTVTEISVCVEDTNEGRMISVEWYAYNPEEKEFYSEDEGDIEYHIKMAATGMKGEEIKMVAFYDNVFIDKSKKDEETIPADEDGPTASPQEIEDAKADDTTLEDDKDDGTPENTTADGTTTPQDSKDSNEDGTSATPEDTTASARESLEIEVTKDDVTRSEDAQDDDTPASPSQDTTASCAPPASPDVSDVTQLAQTPGDSSIMAPDSQTSHEVSSGSELKQHTELVMETEDDKAVATEAAETQDDQAAETQDDQAAETQDDQAAETQDDQAAETQDDQALEVCDKQESHSQLKKKRIIFQTPFDSDMLDSILCINASIQPKVSLQVKMLPPHKIADKDYMIGRDRLDSGDISWTIDAKREIEQSGRVNEVTLEGQQVCKQHVLGTDSETKVEFTCEVSYQEDLLTVSGVITPVAEAEYYLVQLVDGADIAVIIKQSVISPPKLSYEIKASSNVFDLDFPETSRGPYLVSVLALRADFSACSAFSDSELEITRYPPPEHVTETLPDLDSSESADIVKLNWRHPQCSEVDDAQEVSPTPESTDDAPDEVPENSSAQSSDDESAIENSDDLDEQDSLTPGADNAHTSSTESMSSEQARNTMSSLYTVAIRGVRVKKPQDFTRPEAISIENVDSSDEAFRLSEQVREHHYEFSLQKVLEENAHKLQDGLLFQCQVMTDGPSKLHSIPKSFSEFVLLAPPTNLAVNTLRWRPGLCISWEYCAHAISYRLELLTRPDQEIAFSKVLKCGTGGNGEVVLYKNELKDIPCTSEGRGYLLQMYSLGFGQDLIRCLSPTKSNKVLHVIPTKLQYFADSNLVSVSFWPIDSRGFEYVVGLCHITGDNQDDPQHLTARKLYDHEVQEETVVDFSLEKWQHLLESGDSITAWIYSVTTAKPGVMVIGAPQEEVCVMDTPNLTTSFLFHPNSAFVSGMKLTLSNTTAGRPYQYGYYVPGNNEYIPLKETKECEAIFDFSVIEGLPCDGFGQFHAYVTTIGKSGTFIKGAVSLDTNTLYRIASPSLVKQDAVIYTPILLERLWRKHLVGYILSHCFSPVTNPQRFLFPSGERFPSLRIPRKFTKKFWTRDNTLFGKGMQNVFV